MTTANLLVLCYLGAGFVYGLYLIFRHFGKLREDCRGRDGGERTATVIGFALAVVVMAAVWPYGVYVEVMND